MAGTPTPIFLQTVSNFAVQLQRSTSTTLTTFVTGTTSGLEIVSMNASNTDATHDIQFYAVSGAVNYLLTTLNIAASAGNISTVAAADILRASNIPSLMYDNNGNRILYLATGFSLGAQLSVSMATGTSIFIYGQAGGF